MKDEKKNFFTESLKKGDEITLEPGDYIGEDGLVYCGKCHVSRQFRFESGFMNGMIIEKNCQCGLDRIAAEREKDERIRHNYEVEKLKKACFTDKKMQKWCFDRDNGKCPQMEHARKYVQNWKQMEQEQMGLLLYGDVGTGKSYMAACIANALLEQEITVQMTNFSIVLNDLSTARERNDYIDRLCHNRLLIIDDFGMERSSEYKMEQMFQVVDKRCRSGKPLIVTTNLSLNELKNPENRANTRIYDRLIEICVPIAFYGKSMRLSAAEKRFSLFKDLENQDEKGE